MSERLNKKKDMHEVSTQLLQTTYLCKHCSDHVFAAYIRDREVCLSCDVRPQKSSYGSILRRVILAIGLLRRM